MSAWNWMFDLDQQSRIYELEERVEKLEEQNQILYEWVQHFKNNMELRDGIDSNRPV